MWLIIDSLFNFLALFKLYKSLNKLPPVVVLFSKFLLLSLGLFPWILAKLLTASENVISLPIFFGNNSLTFFPGQIDQS